MPVPRPILAALFALMPGAALAELAVCNETDVTVSVAIGYNEGGVWTSEGWWNVEPGRCATVVAGDLDKAFYYWRATSERYGWEESRYMFCTSPEVFTIRGDTDCEARGYREEAFNEIALDGATSYRLTLTASAPRDMPGPDAPIGQGALPAPGTHGEPYTVSGILSHCDVLDASIRCEIHSEGWRYVATSAGEAPTPLAILERLNDTALNTPVRISGDLVSYEGHSADVTIREVGPGEPDRFAEVRDALQGLWRSEHGNEVLIDGGLWQELLLGMPVFRFPMHITDECMRMASRGPVINLRSAETGEWESCIVIIDLTATRLHVSFAEAGGGEVYRRVE